MRFGYILAICASILGVELLPQSPFGMGIYFGNRYSLEEMKRAGKMAQDIGIKWSREEFSWWVIQPEEDKWDFSKYDSAVDIAQSYGISLFGLLDYGTPWASTAPEGAEAPWFWLPRLDAWQRYVETTINRYKNRIKYWEIWNEPNIEVFWKPKPNPEDYLKLLQVSYTTAKRVDPTCKVIGICSSSTDTSFIEEVLKRGGGKYMDILSIHPYRTPRTPEETNFLEELQRLRGLLQKYDVNVPIWITEIGWPTCPGGVSEEEQAKMLVRTYVIAIGSKLVEKVFWYDFRDDGTNPNDPEHNFGIIKRDFVPKKAYTAFGIMTKALEGKKAEGRVDLWDDNLWCFSFSKGKQFTLVMWAGKEEGSTALKVSGKKLKIYDMYGKPQNIPMKEGQLILRLTTEPIYLEGVEKWEVVSPPLQFLISRFRLTGGTESEISLLIENTFSKPWEGEVSLIPPPGWKVEPSRKDYKLSGGDYQYVNFKIQIPLEAEGSYPLKAVLKSKDGVVASASAVAEVARPFSILLKPSLSPTLAPSLEVIIRSRASQEVPARIVIKSSELGIEEEKEVTVKQGDTSLRYPIQKPIEYARAYQVSASLQAGSLSVSQEKTLTFYPCLKTSTPPTIDGAIGENEWSTAIPIRLDKYGKIEGKWKGEDDLSATAYFLWDSNNVYFAMEVKDDVFHQPFQGEDIWQGDSIQIGLALDPINDPQGIFHVEAGLALTFKGPMLWVWHAPGFAFQGEYKLPGLVIRREGNRTIYEATVPYSELGVAVKPGTLIGISLLVNDSDGEGRKAWIEWGGGLAREKDPRLYWDMLLIEGK